MTRAVRITNSCAAALIVGLGSPFGDDQFGWRVVDRLKVTIRKAHNERTGGESHERRDRLKIYKAATPVELLPWLDGVDRLLICDACHGCGKTGDVARWHWPTDQIQHTRARGSHDFRLVTVLELASTLGELPQKVDIWAAEISVDERQKPRPNDSLSPRLEESAQQVAQAIAKELNLA